MSIELKNVTYTYSPGTAYESHALKDVSLVIPDGQFIGIIGHTGSGKSTLIQHLNALVQPTSGQVLYNGEDVWAEKYDRKQLRSEVGLVFQYPEHQLFENDVISDVCFGPMNQGLSREEAEKEAKQNELPAPADEEKTVFTQRDLIQFKDFGKVQLVVAKVLKCEKIPKADKLLMSTLKVGDTERVVVSGIAKFYTPEEMVGKKVVLLANLAPRKIRGVESHGMLLCAANADDSKLSLLTVDSDMEDGCEIG